MSVAGELSNGHDLTALTPNPFQMVDLRRTLSKVPVRRRPSEGAYVHFVDDDLFHLGAKSSPSVEGRVWMTALPTELVTSA